MIRSIGLILGIFSCCLTATCQYTYFNQLSIESGLEFGNYETSTNLEVVGDEFILWGGKGIDGIPNLFLKRFDSSGVALEESSMNFGDSVVYIGGTNSFLSIPNSEDFLFSHTVYFDGIGQGFIIKFSSNLDTVWTKTYNEYAPETYFYTHAPSESGFIIAGENGPELGERGTFIMEIDHEGEVLWHNEIHAPEEGLFRNVNISEYGEYYIVSGLDQNGNDSESFIEILSTNGVLLESLQDDSPPPLGQGGRMLHLINSDNEIIVCQAVGYSYLEPPPSLAFIGLRIYKLDIGNSLLEEQEEYFENENWLGGHIRKMIEVSDGYVLAGGYREPLLGVNQRKGWIMKIDNSFQQEWYTELSYDDAPGNAHYPYDMEQTSDGGYVLVGAYRNSADFYDRTWLVKVDACGDLEWQGCEESNGIWEHKGALPLEIYPNPARDFVRIQIPSHGVQHGQSLQILDMAGKVVIERSNDQLRMTNDKLDVNLSGLASGLYSVVYRTEKGEVYSEKLVVE